MANTSASRMTASDCKNWADFFKGAIVKTKSGKFNWEVTGCTLIGGDAKVLLKRTLTDSKGDSMTLRGMCNTRRIRLTEGTTDTKSDWRNSRWNGSTGTMSI